MKPATRTANGIACPHCGGTQFSQGRTKKGILLGGFFLAKVRLHCLSCGKALKRP